MGTFKLSREVALWTLLSLLLALCAAYEEDAEPTQTDRHSNRPRFLNIFSRPHPEADKQIGVGLKQHLSNVMNGGTIGLHTEFRPLAPVHGFLDKAKKFLPNPDISGMFDFAGKGKKFPDGHVPEDVPDEEEPVAKPGKPEELKPVRPGVESEDQDWEPRDPKKPKTDGPKWEDIGEGDFYGEDIIQPRVRPKRFVDSHIYHVPLEFVSNAKPYQVKIRRPNQL